MKTLLSSLLVTLSLLFSVTTYSQNQRVEALRIMTYNIRNGMGMDDKTDYNRTAGVIKKWHPDVVAVQEIDSITNRSGKKFVVKEIAELAGMYYAFAPAINYDGGRYGIGLLSREKPLKTSYKALPGREEERTMLIAEFEKYIFICVHLSLTAEDQITSMDIINDIVRKINKPVFIAGDFNAEPNSKTINKLQQNFKVLSPLGAKTYPADNPVEAIDYIAINEAMSRKFKLQNTFVVDEPKASDHRPIVVDILRK